MVTTIIITGSWCHDTRQVPRSTRQNDGILGCQEFTCTLFVLEHCTPSKIVLKWFIINCLNITCIPKQSNNLIWFYLLIYFPCQITNTWHMLRDWKTENTEQCLHQASGGVSVIVWVTQWLQLPGLLCRGHCLCGRDQARHRPCHDGPGPANIATSQGEASDSFQHRCEGRRETFVKLHQNCVSCHHHLDAVKHCFKWMIWKGLTSAKASSSSDMTLTWPPRNLNLTSTSPSIYS